jgi:beta-lactamase regulating signal transducer with metallopeptidase domain
MSAIQMLSTQPWVEQLGSTLLHFLWEGLAIAAVYAAGRRWTEQSFGPNARYIVACVALAMMAAAPVVTWIVLSPPAAKSVAASFAAPLSDSAPSAFRSAPVLLPDGAARGGGAPLLLWVVAIWLAGATAFWIRMLGGWILAERLRSSLVRRASGEWQQALDRLKTRLRVSRPVQLLVSSLVQAPVVVGWLRPAVLVPVGALAGLPADQVEALLLHELAHIRRHDYLVNLLQGVVEAILFYHPAVWWISGHIRVERELCCDDMAVAESGDVLTYARALAGLEFRPTREWSWRRAADRS